MAERDAVERVTDPVTVEAMVTNLRRLGVEPGQTLLVHSSLSSLGWVVGGAHAVVEALRTVVTESGTLVMPTQSAQYSNPSLWSNPPVPDHWVPQIRESMPAYRPEVTPTRDVGTIPEVFRTYPDVVRSAHPVYSFAAWGADADAVVADHALDCGLGEQSPLAAVYEREGTILQLGTTHDTNTSLHLAEYRADLGLGRVSNTAPVLRDGERVLVEYEDIDLTTEDFLDIGSAFENEHAVATGNVGDADATLLDQRSIVDFAVEWMETNR